MAAGSARPVERLGDVLVSGPGAAVELRRPDRDAGQSGGDHVAGALVLPVDRVLRGLGQRPGRVDQCKLRGSLIQVASQVGVFPVSMVRHVPVRSVMTATECSCGNIRYSPERDSIEAPARIR